MAACGGVHFWSRELTLLGHTIRMMAPAFAKADLKSNKNDRNDAVAICETLQQPSMRVIQPKVPKQQAVLHLHHGRQLLVRQHVALSNHMQGTLLKYSVVLQQGVKVISRRWPELQEDADNDLPILARHLLSGLKAEYDQLIDRVDPFEHS